MQGACRGMDSAFFFHPEGERGPARANREARAKQICQRCPVLEQCRRHALAVHEPYGVWGGLSESERDTIIRDQQRRLRIPAQRKNAQTADGRSAEPVPPTHQRAGPFGPARGRLIASRQVSGRARDRGRPPREAAAAPACRRRRFPW